MFPHQFFGKPRCVWGQAIGCKWRWQFGETEGCSWRAPDTYFPIEAQGELLQCILHFVVFINKKKIMYQWLWILYPTNTMSTCSNLCTVIWSWLEILTWYNGCKWTEIGRQNFCNRRSLTHWIIKWVAFKTIWYYYDFLFLVY